MNTKEHGVGKLLTISAGLLVALTLTGAGCETASTTSTTASDTTVSDTMEKDDDAMEKDDEMMEEDDAMEMEYEISIVTPVDGATVSSDMELEVEIEGFELDPDSVEGENVEGEGHYHVWVDGEYYSPHTSASTTVEGLEAGEHEIMVSLQNNDHSDLDPAVVSEAVTVTVE